MIVKYPVHTNTQYEATSIAQSMALSNGFKRSIIMGVKRVAPTEWLITLDVQKQLCQRQTIYILTNT